MQPVNFPPSPSLSFHLLRCWFDKTAQKWIRQEKKRAKNSFSFDPPPPPIIHWLGLFSHRLQTRSYCCCRPPRGRLRPLPPSRPFKRGKGASPPSSSFSNTRVMMSHCPPAFDLSSASYSTHPDKRGGNSSGFPLKSVWGKERGKPNLRIL